MQPRQEGGGREGGGALAFKSYSFFKNLSVRKIIVSLIAKKSLNTSLKYSPLRITLLDKKNIH